MGHGRPGKKKFFSDFGLYIENFQKPNLAKVFFLQRYTTVLALWRVINVPMDDLRLLYLSGTVPINFSNGLRDIKTT